VVVDLATGKVKEAEGRSLRSRPTREEMPAGLEKELVEERERRRADESYLALRVLATEKYAGFVLARLLPDERMRVVVKRWDRKTGKALDPLELFTGRAGPVAISADGRTVLIDRSPPTDEVPQDPGVWMAFSSETGKPLVTFSADPSATGMTAVGRRAFYLVQERRREGDTTVYERTLKVVDLETGKKLWERRIAGRALPMRPFTR
jgi:hypothetical protein